MIQLLYPILRPPTGATTGLLRGTNSILRQSDPSSPRSYRLISAALIPLTVAPFAAGTLNPIMDAILCATILTHSHIGFQYVESHFRMEKNSDTARSVIIDYIPSRRLPKTRALFWWGLRAATLTVAVGLYEFETNDVGLTEAVKRIWIA